MYISSVSLTNFRGYRRAETTFVHPGAGITLPAGGLKNVTLLVGVNGSGKTSVLRAVALGALAPVINESGYRPYYLVRRAKAGSGPVQEGRIVLDGVLGGYEMTVINRPPMITVLDSLRNRLDIARRNDYDITQFVQFPEQTGSQNINPLMLKSNKNRLFGFVYDSKTYKADPIQFVYALEEYYKDFCPSFFLLGYGANRRVEVPGGASLSSSIKDRGRRYFRVAGLFEEGVAPDPAGLLAPTT